MLLKELLNLIEQHEMLIVICNENIYVGNKTWFLSCLNSSDSLAQVSGICTNEYGDIVITVVLDYFRD